MRVALCQPNTCPNIFWGFGHLHLWSFDWRIPEKGSGFEIKAFFFSSWVDPAFVCCGRFLWKDEQTDLPVITTDTACVCVNQKQVCVRLPSKNSAELVSSCIWKVTVWKPELQLNNVLVSDGAHQLFLVARDVTESRVGSIIKALITQNIDDNPLDQKMGAPVYIGHETQAGFLNTVYCWVQWFSSTVAFREKSAMSTTPPQ